MLSSLRSLALDMCAAVPVPKLAAGLTSLTRLVVRRQTKVEFQGVKVIFEKFASGERHWYITLRCKLTQLRSATCLSKHRLGGTYMRECM